MVQTTWVWIALPSDPPWFLCERYVARGIDSKQVREPLHHDGLIDNKVLVSHQIYSFVFAHYLEADITTAILVPNVNR